MNKHTALAFLGAFLIGIGLADAGTIKTWTTGEVLTSTDINANFQHIHNTMVGGHGARLRNADVASSAAIAHSKMATPGLLPKAWAVVSSCSSSPCTVTESSGISTVTRASAGNYTVTFSVVRADANIAVFASAFTNSGDLASPRCMVGNVSAVGVNVLCYSEPMDGGVQAAADAAFSFLMLDAEG